MYDFLFGLGIVIAIILFLEIFKQFDKKTIASFTLVGISFIYVGFVWEDVIELFVVSISVLIFISLSYFGFTKNYKLIALGLILHGIWDLVFPIFSNSVPEGYDVFCLTVDFLLAAYFYLRINQKYNMEV